MGFSHVQSDHGLYIIIRDGVRMYMPVFVDDIELSGGSQITQFEVLRELLNYGVYLCFICTSKPVLFGL